MTKKKTSQIGYRVKDAIGKYEMVGGRERGKGEEIERESGWECTDVIINNKDSTSK